MWYRTPVLILIAFLLGGGYILSLLKRTITPEAYEIQYAGMKEQFREDIHLIWNGADEEEEEDTPDE